MASFWREIFLLAAWKGQWRMLIMVKLRRQNPSSKSLSVWDPRWSIQIYVKKLESIYVGGVWGAWILRFRWLSSLQIQQVSEHGTQEAVLEPRSQIDEDGSGFLKTWLDQHSCIILTCSPSHHRHPHGGGGREGSVIQPNVTQICHSLPSLPDCWPSDQNLTRSPKASGVVVNQQCRWGTHVSCFVLTVSCDNICSDRRAHFSLRILADKNPLKD